MAGKSADALTADLAESPASQNGRAGQAAGTERAFAEVLADVVHLEQVPVDSHFFDDLGADSLVMAHFCARVRKRADLPSVSMKDIYRHPTISSLAAAIAEAAPAAIEPSAPAPAEVAAHGQHAASTSCAERCSCWSSSATPASPRSSSRLGLRAGSPAAPATVDIYLRSVLFGGAAFVVLCTLPILAKWVLIGRWKPQQIRVWSLAYVRFWIVKTLVRSNPLVLLFAGSPLYALYLRALGAKVGRGVAIFSRPGARVHRPAHHRRRHGHPQGLASSPCYRAQDGWIQTGAVTLGRDVFVGEKTVLDIDTSMGDGAQLGHASALHSGQAVPAGERWHGSPAQRTDVDYRDGRARRLRHAAPGLVLRRHRGCCVFFAVPAAGRGRRVPAADRGAAGWARCWIPACVRHDAGRSTSTPWSSPWCCFFGAVLVGLLFVLTVPRLLNLVIKPDTVYPLYGVPLPDPPGDRPADQRASSSRTCSVTAPTSSTTCAASGTTCPASSRPGRTSARRWSTRTRT